jgi:hypothetical protein
VSYDLLVFDPAAAPRERAAFNAWYKALMESSDGETAFELSTTSTKLQTWYHAMIADWPDMQNLSDNEIDDDEFDHDRVTGYSFAKYAIYLDFRWSAAEDAYVAVRKSAVEQGVGFYDVSGDEGEGEIYFPDGELMAPSEGLWRNVAADFRSGDLDKYVSKIEPPKRRWFDFFWRIQK